MDINPRLSFIAIVLFSILISGCTGFRDSHQKTSVVDYLYPDKDSYIETATIPQLTLPIKVGIAFVPGGYSAHQTLTENAKTELMDKVASHFKQHDYVKSIEIIPSAYLRPGGSFANLDQIRTMYGIDVIALVSYDQTQFNDQTWASVTYWTIVGAYIVPGEANDTHTMVDTTVYDIASRKMLFRAPGISYIESNATLANLDASLREDSYKGFEKASDDLIINLGQQLELFKQKVKESPESYQIRRSAGYTGSGSISPALLLLLSFVGLFFLYKLRRTQ